MDIKEFDFGKFFALAPVHIYMIDVFGCYRASNELQAKDFGLLNSEALIGKTIYDLPCFQNYPKVIEILEKNNQRVFEERKPIEFYEPFPLSNGTFAHYKSHKIPIFQDEKLIGLIGLSFELSQEIDKINTLKIQLEQNELTFFYIINHLPEHIYWLDRDNNFLGCNENQAKDFGLKQSSDIVGLHVSSFQTSENAKAIIKNNLKILKSGKSMTTEEHFQNKKGEDVIYLSKKVPLKNKSDEIIGILGISVDITKIKKTEQELILQKNRALASEKAKSEFLRNMEH
jgi:two-component system aerobic respiration control sensor histidine kinase ArcB